TLPRLVSSVVARLRRWLTATRLSIGSCGLTGITWARSHRHRSSLPTHPTLMALSPGVMERFSVGMPLTPALRPGPISRATLLAGLTQRVCLRLRHLTLLPLPMVRPVPLAQRLALTGSLTFRACREITITSRHHLPRRQ